MYPCGVCEEECLDNTIQCSECEKWTHRTCVPMEPEILNTWADANLKFLCKECCYEDGQFQQTKSLQRYLTKLFSYLQFFTYFISNIIAT
jgi:hypothetical protein